MELRLIRNATMRLRYAGLLILTDPLLAAKHAMPSYAGVSPNPLVDLPCSPEEVIAGVDFTLLSHLHSDHFDPAAQKLLPSDTPISCQPGDEARITAKGFTNVTAVENVIQHGALTLTRVPAQHGAGKVLDDMGVVSGYVLQAPGEPTVYWAGDSIWYDAAQATVSRYTPDIIITHSCGAVWGEQRDLIVMDATQTLAVCRAAPGSVVVAIHMEALDHATITRADLRATADASGIPASQLLIPQDGETLMF